MSRVGNAAIKLPSGVSLSRSGEEIKIKGPKGELTSPLPTGIDLKEEDGSVSLSLGKEDADRHLRAMHGTVRALLANCVKGVSDGFVKNLELVGVGYRVSLKGKELTFSLGYSHDV